MYRISKRFEFSASHQLRGLPPAHQCGRLHGHNYTVEVVLESTAIDHTGFVRDYGELAPLKKWLDDTFDHRHVNDTLPQPTAEWMAKFIFDKAASMFHEVVAVTVSETGKTTATYEPHNLPPIERILNVIELLAAEPDDNLERQRLQSAFRTLMGL